MYSFGFKEVESYLTFHPADFSPEDANRAAYLLRDVEWCQWDTLRAYVQEGDGELLFRAALATSSWRPISLYENFSRASTVVDKFWEEKK